MALTTLTNSTSPTTVRRATTDNDVYDRETQLAGLAENFDGHDHSAGKNLAIKRVQSGTFAARPAAGNAGHVYVATDTGQAFFDTGAAWVLSGFVNPMTTAGDLIQGGAAGVASRLGIGTAYQMPRVNAGATAVEYVGGAANGVLVSRFINEATLNVSATSGYTDFGGSFTTAITTLAGDKVHLRAVSIFKKLTAGNISIVVDRGGTKLPGTGTAGNVYADLLGSYIPFAFEHWDTPGAGTFTYKPQVHSNDANLAQAGGGLRCLYVVELWR